MLINITVESNFTSPANGYTRISVDNTQHVQFIIDKFCERKGIDVNPKYQLITQNNDPLSGSKLIQYYDLQDGDKLFLGNSGDFKPFRFTNWFAISALAIFLGIGGMAICISIYILMRDIPDSYAIVFDAGSTHTDTILFKWPGSKINNTGLVTEVHECYTEDGIADISPYGNNISNYLDKCLGRTRNYIHPDSSKYTEVFFGATAGMRLLQEINKTKAYETMVEVTRYLHMSGLEFEDSQAQIISGVSEGVTGWITVNYLNRHLQSKNRELTRGALDMGGASTQISFEVDELIGRDNPYVQQVKLYGKKFYVYCQSFLCYGSVQALLRYRALIFKKYIESNNGGKNVSSPCEPLGLKTEVLASRILGSPCTPKSVNILHYLGRRNLNETIVFVGTSDHEKCQSNIKYLLSQEFCQDMFVDNDKCLNVTHTPSGFQQKTFTGFSGFAYARKNLNLTKQTTKDEFLVKTKLHCNLTLEQIIDKVSKDKTQGLKNQMELCFKAVFVYTLLSDVYKFETNSMWSNIAFENDIENKTLGWALGYMVNATESISTSPSIPTFDTIAFLLLIVLFCVFILLGAAFYFQAQKFRKSDQYKGNNPRPVLSNC